MENPFITIRTKLQQIVSLAVIAGALLIETVFAVPIPPNIRITNIPDINNEEQVFLSPVDSNIVIANWRDFRLGYRQIGIGRSTDGGQTWVDSLIEPDKQYFNIITGDPNRAWQSDPTMTVDRQGNFYMSVLDFLPDAPPGNDSSTIVFYKSIDSGLTWIGPIPTITEFVGLFEDKQFITVDRTGGPHDGNLYVAWARFPSIAGGGNRIMFQRSITGGLSFEDTLLVGPSVVLFCNGADGGAGQFANPIVASDGTVHALWIGRHVDTAICAFDGYVLRQVSSTDGGATFSPQSDILRVSGFTSAPGGIATYSAPVGDADITGGPFHGNVYLAFTNRGAEDNTFFRTDVDFIRSTDNGFTWGGRMQINDDSLSTFGDSFHPWLIVNQEGVIVVVFYDHRVDNLFYEDFNLFAAYSFDGGETFTTNHRISSVSSTPGGLLGSSFARAEVWPTDDDGEIIATPVSSRAGLLAEYIGVTAFYDKILAVWTDSRDGNSEVYTSTWRLPLLSPRLLSLENGAATLGNPELTWATGWKHNLDRYRYEVSTDPTFIDPLALIDSATTDTNRVSLSGLTDGIHYWRVKAFDQTTGDSSDYSLVYSFVVDNTPPSVVSLIAPPDNTVSNNPAPVFDWSDAGDINLSHYELELSLDSNFPPSQTDSVLNIQFSTTGLPTPLISPGEYFWRVRAFDELGNNSLSGTFSYVFQPFVCGDANGSGTINIADATFLIAYIFSGGATPVPLEAGDANGSGTINISDATYLIAYIFSGGASPVCGTAET